MTEDEYCAAHGVTHKEYRASLRAQGLPMPKDYSLGLEQELCLAYHHDNVSIADLYDQYGVPMNKLRYHYLKRKPFATCKKRETVLRMLDEGYSTAQIIDELGCTASYISMVKPRDQVRKFIMTDAKWAQIKEQLKSNSITTVAKLHNISRSSIYNRLNREGEH